jgi:hypothetical protein
MKINRRSNNRKRRAAASGSAVLVVVILLGIMTTLVVANSRTLYYLHRDLKVTEQKQQRRFEKTLPAQPPATASATNQVEKLK